MHLHAPFRNPFLLFCLLINYQTLDFTVTFHSLLIFIVLFVFESSSLQLRLLSNSGSSCLYLQNTAIARHVLTHKKLKFSLLYTINTFVIFTGLWK